MISFESIRSAIKNPSYYGIAFAFVGAIGIFLYGIYHNSVLWQEKEEGNNFISIQLSAFAPPSKDPIAERVEHKKAHHKPHKEKPKQEQIEAKATQVPTPLQAVEKIEKEEAKQAEQQENIKEPEAQDMRDTTVAKPNPEAVATENIKTMRFSDGVENEFLQAIHKTMQRYLIYPPHARNLGYEGEVLVKFLIDFNGHVSELQVVKKSPHTMLDKAALKTLKKACKHFPKPNENIYIEIPVAFNLDRR